MPTITLKAHFDGQRILLDEPFDLPANSSLMVTVLLPSATNENNQWANIAMRRLAEAYSDNEPDYSLSLETIKQ
jgi:hypothetical protein